MRITIDADTIEYNDNRHEPIDHTAELKDDDIIDGILSMSDDERERFMRFLQIAFKFRSIPWPPEI